MDNNSGEVDLSPINDLPTPDIEAKFAKDVAKDVRNEVVRLWFCSFVTSNIQDMAASLKG